MKITLEIRVVHENVTPEAASEPEAAPEVAQQYPPVPPHVAPKLRSPVESFRRGTYI